MASLLKEEKLGSPFLPKPERERERDMAGGDGSGDITSLPEDCISHVISLTSPRDCCRSAAVSGTFRSAAGSDTVWERFLPSDHDEILSRAVDRVEFQSKRDLYFHLCDPVLLDGGRMSFSLERPTGRKCYTLSARGLVIVWGDTPHYWKWGRLDGSRFAEVAELLNVCWLEIHGRIDGKVLSRRTNYAAYLIFKLAHDSRSFNYPNQEASVRVGSYVSESEVCLLPQPATPTDQRRRTGRYRFPSWRRLVSFQPLPEGEESNVDLPPEGEETSAVVRSPRTRADGWMEMELGEFFSGDGDDGEVVMSLLEVKGGHWKSGLIIEGIEVRPK